MPRSRRNGHLLFAALALVMACYSNTFHGPFVFDDIPNIVQNPVIRDLRNFVQPSRLAHAGVPSGYLYSLRTRYMAHLTFALNYRIHGLDVVGFHAVNLAIHLITSLLLYLIVRRILELPSLAASRIGRQAPAVAFFCASLFACHPIQTQAVTYVVQRMASLSAMLCLLGLYAYLVCWSAATPTRRRWLAFAAALASLAAAMLTKQNAFVFPIVIALADLLFLGGRPSLRAGRLGPVLATALVVPIAASGSGRIRDTVIAAVTARSPAAPDVSSFDYFLTQQRVIVSYLRLLLLPVGQNADHQVRVSRSLWEPTVFLSALLLVGLLAGAVGLVWRGRRDEPALRLAGFGMLWFFICLSVESGIVPLEDIMVEHRLYLPSAGFFICVVTLLFLVAQRRAALLKTLLWVGLFALTATTWARNRVWGDAARFWGDVAAKDPGNSRALNNLGNLAFLRGVESEALAYYQRASAANPRNFEPLYNAGTLLVRLGRTSEAIAAFRRAIPLDVYQVRARDRISEIAATEQRRLAAGFDPGPAHLHLGLAWQALGDSRRAAAEFENAERYAASSVAASVQLGRLRLEESKMDEARRAFETALAADPANLAARRGLAQALATEGPQD